MENSQLAAWPQAQQTEIGDEELGRVLLARLRDREARLAALDTEFRALRTRIEREHQHVDHLRALLEDLGRVFPEGATPTSTTNNGTRPDTVTAKAFVAGNRNPKMPERQPEFASVSVAEAARRLLSGGETMHTNDIARAVYRIENDAQLRLVNATVRSTLAVGVTKEQWERGEEPSTFRMRQETRGEPW